MDAIDRSDFRDAAVLARTELRTHARHILADTRRTLATGFLLLLFGLVFPAVLWNGAREFGEQLANGSVPLGSAGAVCTAVVLLGGYVGAAAGFNQPRVGAIGPLVRTSIPPRAVSLGRLGNETVQSVGLMVPAVLVLLLAVGVGAGDPVVPLLVAATLVPLLAAALLAGRIVGDLLRYSNERLSISLWTKALVSVGLMTGVYVGVQLLLGTQFEGEESLTAPSIPAVLPGEPLQAYAGVLFAPLGSTATLLGVAVFALTLATVPLALYVSIRMEAALLVRDVGADDDGLAAQSRGVPRVFALTPATRVAWRYLLRTRRDPRTLAHLGPLLFGAMAMLASGVREPASLLVTGPPAIVIGGVCLAGAAYCLNPLGDDVDQLPLLLTSSDSTAVLLRGRMLAGLLPGLLLAIGLGTPLALIRQSPAFVLGQALLAVVLATAGTGVALGIGAIVPKFERQENMGVERAHPSNTAVLGFFFGSILVGAVGLLALVWTLDGAAPTVALVVWGVYLTLLGIGGYGGYRYAVRRFDALTLEAV